MMNEEITPTLTKLKEERSTYLEYQKIQRELEHLTKLYIAHKFVTAEETSAEAKEGLDAVKQEMEKLTADIKAGEEEMTVVKARIEELQRHRDTELGGRLEELESDLSTKEKSSLKVEAALKVVKDNVKQEERKKNQIKKGMGTVSPVSPIALLSLSRFRGLTLVFPVSVTGQESPG